MFFHLACHRLFHLSAFAALVAPRTLTEVSYLLPRLPHFSWWLTLPNSTSALEAGYNLRVVCT